VPLKKTKKRGKGILKARLWEGGRAQTSLKKGRIYGNGFEGKPGAQTISAKKGAHQLWFFFARGGKMGIRPVSWKDRGAGNKMASGKKAKKFGKRRIIKTRSHRAKGLRGGGSKSSKKKTKRNQGKKESPRQRIREKTKKRGRKLGSLDDQNDKKKKGQVMSRDRPSTPKNSRNDRHTERDRKRPGRKKKKPLGVWAD